MVLRSFEELTDDTSLTTLIPADVYANLVLEGVVCYGQLSGVVTALEYDMTAGCGQIVQVPYIDARTASCASSHTCGTTSGGMCLSATSSTFGTYPITINAWGDYDLLCDFALWEANCLPIMKLIMNEMSKRLAHCRDAEIWGTIATWIGNAWSGTLNIPHWTRTAATCGSSTQAGGSCCTFSFDIYNSIVSVIQDLRSDCYEPDYVIMNPNVAKYLYYKDGTGLWNTPLVTFEGGHLAEIAGCKVIETGVANDCSSTASDVMAVVIDSKRAVGEAWGKKPEFSTSYIPECNNTKLVIWQYWGADHMDHYAIGHVYNP